jgi:hypothetical protein
LRGRRKGLYPGDGPDLRRSDLQAFECSEYFHLAELSPIASLVYGLAYKLTKGGENLFFASADSVASYLGRSASQVRRGLKQLEAYGLFELESAKTFRTNSYRVLSHKDWATQHPRRCCKKIEFPYTAEGDPLGRQLWQITGGRVEFQQFQVANLRKLGLTDEEIIAEFSGFWKQKGNILNERDVSPYFYTTLRSAKREEGKEPTLTE